MLRVKEGIFETDFCRYPIKGFDKYQLEETYLHIEKILNLQKKYDQ